MPTYDYDCADCGHEFEEFQSIKAPPLEICPVCGGKVSRRIHGGAGLIFKGSGFYLTDYKKAASPSGNGGDAVKKADGDTAKKEGAEKASEKSEKSEKKEKTTTE